MEDQAEQGAFEVDVRPSDVLADVAEAAEHLDFVPEQIVIRRGGGNDWVCRVYRRGSDDFDAVHVGSVVPLDEG